jgi:nucleoside-diphosphate-sugar epimerase
MTAHTGPKKIVIIGGAGFIGHHLALELAQRGARVDVVDSLQVNNLLWFASGHGAAEHRDLSVRMINQRLDRLRAAGIPLHPLDARDYHTLCRMLDSIKPDIIVHLAAVSHAGQSNKDPYSTFDHSLRTLENALDNAKKGIERFVYLSSSMAYGNFLTPSVDETHPLEPLGIYGALKVAGEKMVIAYQQVFQMPYTIIRPSALYGPRCVSRRVGQMFIESALNGQKLRIDGDGSDRLDFTYINDLVDGVCLAIDHPAAKNQIFNMTYGQSRSISELASVVRQQFPGVDAEYVARDVLMPFRGTLSIEKARRLLGYAPKHAIEEGFVKYIQWYRELTAEIGAPTPAVLA